MPTISVSENRHLREQCRKHAVCKKSTPRRSPCHSVLQQVRIDSNESSNPPTERPIPRVAFSHFLTNVPLMISKDIFQHNLLDWFSSNKRDLPWRKDYSPYKVWVSEIMLQQTQMERGVSYFNRWMRRFPTIESVALAPEDEILNLWEGLGYYRRARNLHKTAKLITNQYDGIFPTDHTTILSLPGIGPYTAAAISSIAFKEPIPVLDANVIRVLSRIFDVATPVATSSTRKILTDHATYLLSPKHARDFNQALMELGALVCTKSPVCLQCPLKSLCKALDKGTIAERPVLSKPPAAIPVTMASGVLVHEGRIFIQKRCTHDDLWAGLWEFPGGSVVSGEHPREAVVREFLEETELAVFPLKKIAVIKHSYTRYRVTLHAYFCSICDVPRPTLHTAQKYQWVTPAGLSNFAFSSGHRKLVDILLANQVHTATMG